MIPFTNTVEGRILPRGRESVGALRAAFLSFLFSAVAKALLDQRNPTSYD